MRKVVIQAVLIISSVLRSAGDSPALPRNIYPLIAPVFYQLGTDGIVYQMGDF